MSLYDESSTLWERKMFFFFDLMKFWLFIPPGRPRNFTVNSFFALLSNVYVVKKNLDKEISMRRHVPGNGAWNTCNSYARVTNLYVCTMRWSNGWDSHLDIQIIRVIRQIIDDWLISIISKFSLVFYALLSRFLSLWSSDDLASFLGIIPYCLFRSSTRHVIPRSKHPRALT